MSDSALDQSTGLFELLILTPDAVFLKTRIEMITIPGIEGEFGVLAAHAPFFTRTKAGFTSFNDGGMPRRYVIAGGYVEVLPDRVVILADKILSPEEISPEEAAAELARLEKRFEKLDQSDLGYARALEELEFARACFDLVRGD